MKTKLNSLYYFVATLVLAFASILAIWTDRTLDFWITYFKGSGVNVPYWLSLIITIVLNGIIIGVNIISELIRLFVLVHQDGFKT